MRAILPKLAGNFLLLALCLLLTHAAALAEEYSGEVVGITDGDTLTLLIPTKQQIKVRLAEIDTPERSQPYATRARQALSDLAFGRATRVIVVDRDRYGRVVGRVYVGDVDVNAELVRQGAAWVYRDYARDRELFVLEEEARRKRLGLWALPETQRTPPWEWRKRSKRPSVQVAGKSAPSTCGTKRTCKQMVTCAEAQFYLSTCGVVRLDGDGDGIPCESLCR